jgi:hypothetical protein
MERYNNDIPWLLRLMLCWGIQADTYRFRWGEFSPRWGFALNYSVYHETAHVCVQPLWGALYVKAPMVIKQRPGTGDWNAIYGINWFERSIHLNWRDRCKVIHAPWNWRHVRHTYLNDDGTVHHDASPREYEAPEEIKSVYPYRYALRNGTVQERTATIYGDEREWRWRWFTALPWPRKIRRCIDVRFSDEVGERSGSWKGGVIGCGYEWRKDETQEQALRRMEHERKF